MLEQVLIQEFKDKYLMIAPPEVLQHPNYVVLVIWILLHQLFKYLRFCLSKFVVDFSVSVNLQCHALLLLVVVSTHYLGKASLAQDTLDLESVQNVVTWLHC